jgi:Helix-turn-helix domain
MARRHDNKGRSKGYADFVKLDRVLLHTPAYGSLTTQARAVLVELYDRYKGYNNGCIGLSVRSAAEHCNIAKDTANRALRELVEKGFIECVTPGGFSRKTPHATEWRLTQHRCDVTGATPTKGYMKWGREKKTRSQNAPTAVPSRDRSTPSTLSSGPDLGPPTPVSVSPAVPSNGTHIESSHVADALKGQGGPPPSKQGGQPALVLVPRSSSKAMEMPQDIPAPKSTCADDQSGGLTVRISKPQIPN